MLKFNLLQLKNLIQKSFNLNTSHVKVQPGYFFDLFYDCFHLNTSHVKVQREIIADASSNKNLFKYISC